ncbi:hypothetical protein ACO0LC_04465 [Undibacterium sp. JH2W]|uniref:hypothetical protein n=1 Tax=Undibacterium sp. JH2W TaxID=3413037 RepID=UPI003BF3294F
MRMFKRVMVLSMLLAVTLTYAEAAPWYKWRSKLSAHVICSQTSPGEGWEQLQQAFLDARCERPRKD